MDYIEYGYIGLFAITFLSATILPIASEAALIGFLYAGFDPFWSTIVASIGNTAGGTTNYLLGMLGRTKTIEKYMKDPAKLARIEKNVHKYGIWLGLITWLPFIGDPLTIFLGFFRVRFVPLLLLMLIGKTIRYAVITGLWNW